MTDFLLATGILFGIAATVWAMVLWFVFCSEISDYEPWGLYLFLSPVVLLIWLGIYLDISRGGL